MSVAGVLLEYQAGNQLFGDGVAIVFAAPQIGQVLAAYAVQLMLWEGRVPHQVRDQFQGGRPMAGHDLRRNQGGLAAGVGGDAGADELEGGGDVLAAAAFGAALGQHLGREAGQSGQRLGVVGRSAVKDQPHGDQWQSPLLHHHDTHAVAQPVASGYGRDELGLGGGGRHYRPVHGRGGGLKGLLGEDPQPDLTAVQHPFVGLNHLFPLYGQVTAQAGVDQVRVVRHDIVVVELVGPPAEPAHAGQLAVMSRFDAVFDPLYLVLGRWLLAEAFQFLVNGGLDL